LDEYEALLEDLAAVAERRDEDSVDHETSIERLQNGGSLGL